LKEIAKYYTDSKLHILGFIGSCLLLLISSNPLKAQEPKTRLLSPEKVVKAGKMPKGWNRDYWSDSTHYGTEKSSRSDHVALVMQADSFSVSRYYKKVPLTPKATYQLSFWIKTKSVTGKRKSAGAGVRLGKFSFKPDSVFQGTNGWTHREVTFSTYDDDSMVLEFLLGKRGPAKGKVWIDDIELTRVSVTSMNPSITINLSQKQSPLSKYVYGQFIEQMGNSIYGGIWAEMLQDRKFYFKPNSRNSPWKYSSQDSSQLRIDSLDAFTGKYSPVMIENSKANAILSQENLALKSGKKYEGRIVLAGNGVQRPIKVSLSWGDTNNQRDTFEIDSLTQGYKTYHFNFESGSTTRNGKLSIVLDGKGEISIGTASLMSADNIQGFRLDVIALMKELNAPVYRWPGGNFVSGYNWKDGVGDRDKRPPKINLAWESNYKKNRWKAVESNDVGLHEFMKLCNILNAEPYIAINTGLGTARLAAQEVQYLNGSTKTPMGKWRAQNGHPKPFGVKFFAVGNEMFGNWQLGHMPEKKYVKKHNRVAKAMWKVDPDISLVGVGDTPKWNAMMYKNSADYMSYISQHFYRQNWHGGGLMTHVMQMPHAINDIARQHRKMNKELEVLQDKNIPIVLDEWNYWYGPHVYGLLGTRYFLRDALGIAAGINALSRNSDVYFMANYAQTINVIGAIKATPTTSFLAATGVVLKTYRNNFGSIPVTVEGEKLPFDIAACLTKDGKYLTVSVVNPTHGKQKLALKVIGKTIQDQGTATIVTGKNDMVYNSADNKDAVKAMNQPVEIKDNSIQIPAISAVILRFRVK